MEFSRNEEQELAMTIIYDALVMENLNLKTGYDIKEIIEDVCDTPYEEVSLFVKEIVIKALNHKEEIISQIEPNLKNWKFSRLNLITQSIFLLSVAHYQFVKDIEKPIVINVAVSLAKKYVVEDDYKFINAVLDKVL